MTTAYGRDPTGESPEGRLARLAARQHGVFSREQALGAGIANGTITRRLDAGSWERVHTAVYRMVGAPRTWRQALLAACLAWGPGAVASHRAAAVLHGLRGFEKHLIEFTVPCGRRRNGPGIVHRSNQLEGVDTEVVDAIPVTTVARTLIDLAGTAPREAVEIALDDALYRGLVSRSRLRWRLDALAQKGRTGVAVLRALLDERDAFVSVPQNDFETMLRRVVLDGDLPPPIPQWPVRVNGTVVAVVDFAYPDAQVAIEADGRKFHSGRADFERDRERLNALATLGWRVLRITWTALTRRPADVIAAIRTALAA